MTSCAFYEGDLLLLAIDSQTCERTDFVFLTEAEARRVVDVIMDALRIRPTRKETT